MGCTSSDPSTPAFTAARSPYLACLNQPTKQQLRKLIEQDNLLEFAIKIADYNVPLHSEISDSGLKWMMTHFCCRHDSDNILQYLLKHYFAEHGSLYIDYINAPTAQGYTALHLCALWKAEKCFGVLNYYGGLSLSSRDKNEKMPIDVAYQFSCRKMTQTLSNYRDLSIRFTMLEAERLISGNIIAEDPLAEKKRKERNPTINNNTASVESEQMKALKEDKKKLQIQLNQIMEQKIKKQTELQKQKQELQKQKAELNANKIKENQQQQQKEMQAKIDEALKLERDKYKSQMEQKEKQIIRARQELRRAQEKKVEEEKQRAQKLADQFIKQKADQVKQMNDAKNQAVDKLKEKQKQTVQLANEKIKENTVKAQAIQNTVQNTAQNTKNALVDTFKNLKQQLPKQIQKAYANALSKGKYIDQSFPASDKSLGDKSNPNFANFKSTIVWLRPSEIFGGDDFKLFDGIEASDVQQGELGVCYMLATISCLALNPTYIQKMFVFSDTKLGFYVIKLYINGKPKLFTIDDLIPCDKGTNFPIFTQPVGNQLWVMLMEKCWAKAIGSYLSAEGMVPDQMMEDLTGAPGFGGNFEQQDPQSTVTVAQHINTIVQFSGAGSTIVLCSKQDKVEGIVEGHAYSLLQCYQYQGKNVFKLRNPWGNFEWQGQFSQKNKKLAKDFKQLVGYTNDDDGVFYLSESELVRFFSYYSISSLVDDHFYSYLQFKSKKNEDKFFKFTLKQEGYTNVRVTQLFDRMMNDKDYKYSPMAIEMGKIENQKQVTFLSEGDKDTYYGAKSIHASQNVGQQLKPGEYFIRVRMLWENQSKYNSAVLVVYAGQQVQIQQMDYQKGLDCWKKLLFSHAQEIQKQPTQDQVGFYRIDTTKSQFVFIAQTDKPGDYIATFEFVEDQLVGTKVEIGKVSTNKLEVSVNKNSPGVGVVSIVQPSEGGETGQVYISFRKK